MLDLYKIVKKPKLQEFKITEFDLLKVEQYKKEHNTNIKTFENTSYCLSIILYILIIFSFTYLKSESFFNAIAASLCYGIIGFFTGIGFVLICPIIWLISFFKPKEKHHYKEKAVKQYNEAVKQYEERLEMLQKRFPNIEQTLYNEPILTLQIINSLCEEIKKQLTECDKRENKDWWINLTARDFEIEVSRYFNNNGYLTELTPQSNDGGIDVIARSSNETIYIQCKHYNTPVSVGCVRELKGVMADDGVKKGCLACLYGGTEGCNNFAKRNNIQILTLKDFTNDTYRKPSYPTLNLNKVELYRRYINYTDYYIYVELFDNIDDAKTICANNINYAIVYHKSVYIVIKSEESFIKKIRKLISWPSINVNIAYEYSGKKVRKNYYRKHNYRYYR